MEKYSATVKFNVYDIEAVDVTEVHKMLYELIEQLATVKTDLNWDDVDWIIRDTEMSL